MLSSVYFELIQQKKELFLAVPSCVIPTGFNPVTF